MWKQILLNLIAIVVLGFLGAMFFGFWGMIVGLILVVISALIGAFSLKTPQPTNNQTILNVSEEVVMIDGCEYLKIPSYMHHYTLTHKGNCKNPIHQQHN